MPMTEPARRSLPNGPAGGACGPSAITMPLEKPISKSKEEIKEFIKNAARDPHAEKLTNQTYLTIELSAEPD